MPRRYRRELLIEAARLTHAGTPRSAIAEKINISPKTVSRWAKEPEWQQEIDRLNAIVKETTVQVTQEHKQAYRSELLRSRDLLRQVNDQQLQSAAEYAIAARRATKHIMERCAADECTPEEAAERLAKGGSAYLSNVASNIVESAGKQIDRLYAIAQVLEHIETLL